MYYFFQIITLSSLSFFIFHKLIEVVFPSLGWSSCFSSSSCRYVKSWVPLSSSSGPSFWALCGSSQGFSPFQFLLCLGPVCDVVCPHLFISFFCTSFCVLYPIFQLIFLAWCAFCIVLEWNTAVLVIFIVCAGCFSRFFFSLRFRRHVLLLLCFTNQFFSLHCRRRHRVLPLSYFSLLICWCFMLVSESLFKFIILPKWIMSFVSASVQYLLLLVSIRTWSSCSSFPLADLKVPCFSGTCLKVELSATQFLIINHCFIQMPRLLGSSIACFPK